MEAMKRLLLACCLAAAAFPAAARKPHVRFDLPCSREHDKFIVVLGTPAGPRRFIFDTGTPLTAIRESLCREMGLRGERKMQIADFEGHAAELDVVRWDSLRMGELTYCGIETAVLPDSSYVFPCFEVDGILGADLLRPLVVRIAAADSTISFADRIRAFGRPAKRRSCPMDLSTGCPHIPVNCRNGEARIAAWVRFDTGSPDFYAYCRLDEDPWLATGFIADMHWAEGYAPNMGWSNRSAVKAHFQGTVPEFALAGVTIRNMPVMSTHGAVDILGCELLSWGEVILDFPGGRFYFLPREDAVPVAEPQPLYNYTLWVDGGNLVVGTVWDETLQGTIAPGDRVVTVDGEPWAGDICGFLLGRRYEEGMVCRIATACGQVVVPIKKL